MKSNMDDTPIIYIYMCVCVCVDDTNFFYFKQNTSTKNLVIIHYSNLFVIRLIVILIFCLL